MEPGVYQVFHEGKLLKSGDLYAHLFEPMSFSSEKDMVDCFRETFSESVHRQLISDVPVSLFLSGGVYLFVSGPFSGIEVIAPEELPAVTVLLH